MKTVKELYDLIIEQIQSSKPDLTDTHDGSVLDVVAGATATAIAEAVAIAIDEFSKTFFDTANGPEITGGADDLETLAVDHFGDEFSRPAATKSTGTATFSRPDSAAGDIVIPSGTAVKTSANAAGKSQRFVTLSDVTMIGTSINATVEAAVAGPDGNVLAGTVTELESVLLDPTITVDNGSPFAGGADRQSDSEYRETIRRKIKAMKGSSLAGIEAKALTVAGVVKATGIELEKPVIAFDIATGLPVPGAKFFRIPYAKLYIADANGTADAALVALVKAALNQIRAGGAKVDVIGAVAMPLDWSAAISLNPSGPNYAELSGDSQAVKDSMAEYLANLEIGADFNRAAANAAILAIWGPDGTNDLTAFTTTVPSGDVTIDENEKLIAGTMGIS